MSAFSAIVEIHEDLLRTRGYQEAALNATETPGWFQKEFERLLSLTARQAHQYNVPCEFEMKTVGFFNGETDVLLFTLTYEYDPTKKELNVRRLDAKLGEEEKSFFLQHNKELPLAAAVYRGFTKDKNLDLARAIVAHSVEQHGKRILKIS